MIAIPSGVRVWLATGHTDMHRYAEHRVMQSAHRLREVSLLHRDFWKRI